MPLPTFLDEKGLAHKVDRARVEGRETIFETRSRGQHNDGCCLTALPDLEELKARHPRQVYVEDQEVKRLRDGALEGRVPTCLETDFVTRFLEPFHHAGRDFGLVLDDEYAAQGRPSLARLTSVSTVTPRRYLAL